MTKFGKNNKFLTLSKFGRIIDFFIYPRLRKLLHFLDILNLVNLTIFVKWRNLL